MDAESAFSVYGARYPTRSCIITRLSVLYFINGIIKYPLLIICYDFCNVSLRQCNHYALGRVIYSVYSSCVPQKALFSTTAAVCVSSSSSRRPWRYVRKVDENKKKETVWF